MRYISSKYLNLLFNAPRIIRSSFWFLPIMVVMFSFIFFSINNLSQTAVGWKFERIGAKQKYVTMKVDDKSHHYSLVLKCKAYGYDSCKWYIYITGINGIQKLQKGVTSYFFILGAKDELQNKYMAYSLGMVDHYTYAYEIPEMVGFEYTMLHNSKISLDVDQLTINEKGGGQAQTVEFTIGGADLARKHLLMNDF